jgi:uncharacterized repeat protein (TIGR02543 family)
VPNGLDPNLTYQCTITTGAKDLAGNALANNYVWIFTTGDASIVTLPTVSSTDPVNAATGVPLNQKIAATFSVAMDASTFTSATFTLRQGTSSIPGSVSYSGTTAIFAPSSYLAPNTGYTAMITTGTKDLAGNVMAKNYVWSFTTGAAVVVTPPSVSSTDPVNTAAGVALNQKIAATFSKTMDATTIQTSTFTLKQGTTSVSGFVSYIGTTATFAPASNLTSNTLYTATITTGAKDLAGNALANNFEWSFTTGAAAVVTPPTINSTDPADAATGVALNQKIAATFSKTMDATTIQTSTFILRQGITPVSGFVSYSGTTAIFSPASNLVPNSTYSMTITAGAKDLAGNALANNFVWSFTTGAAVAVTPPTVSSTDPVNAAIGVALNQKIAATFSKTMDASTIHTSTFTLKQGTTSVSGFVSYIGTTATFAPASNLAPSTVYTATITTEAKDLAGNALANNFVWNFTTGAAVVSTPPTVSSTDPVNAATGVPLNQKIAATFSKTMDASTFTTSTFTLTQGTTSVSGFVSYSGTTATFAPASNLAPNTVYTATITTSVKDLAGNALANNYVWSFTTGTAVAVTAPTVILTDPVNAAIGVVLSKQIVATFSKTMDASTIQTSTFILMQGTTPISGFVSYSGTIAKFTPASNLAPNTVYTATITTSVKDLAGNALANNYVWSFTTGAAVALTPPTVISTDPTNGATCVALNKQIAATFSMPMNASTITTATFTLMETQGTTFVSGTVSYVGTTATFTPLSNLKPNTTYIATITTGVQDSSSCCCNPMASNYAWSFTTVAPYTIRISSNPTAGGTTSGVGFTNGVGTFNSCSSVTVTAAPNTGYTFTNWTEGVTVVTTNPSYTFTVSGDRTLVANFEIIKYTLSASGLHGTVILNPAAGPYSYGTSVTLTAVPDVGYHFVSWSGDTVGKSAATSPMSVTMIANRIITANFAVNTYTLTTTAVNGTVTKNPNQTTYNYGSNVILTATASPGYTFTGWSGDTTSLINPLTVTMNANKNITANFAITTYTLTITSVNGTVTKNPNQTSYNIGTNVTLTATPSLGYTFTGWSGDTTSSINPLIVTMNANKNITANFAVGTYTLTITSVNGTVAKNPNQTSYNYGTNVTLTATPNTGYTFTGWSGDTTSLTNPLTVTMNKNKNITANFTVLQYTVTLSSNPVAGGTTSSGGGTFNAGTSVTITATPNAGYAFTNWIENGNPVSTNASYTFIINGNRTFIANFTSTLAPGAVDLGLASTYGILSSSAITDASGASQVYGDVAMYPGNANGLLPSQVHGAIHIADGVAQSVYTDLTTAYHFAKNLAPGTTVPDGQDLGTLIVGVNAPGHLPPGTYTSSSTLLINTPVVLDGGGNADAVWIFQIGSSLTTFSGAPGGNVTLTGSAQQKNVFFVPTAAASIGSGTTFYGNILAGGDLTSAGNATIFGRLLAGAIGASTLALNGAASTITVPGP